MNLIDLVIAARNSLDLCYQVFSYLTRGKKYLNGVRERGRTTLQISMSMTVDTVNVDTVNKSLPSLSNEHCAILSVYYLENHLISLVDFGLQKSCYCG